MENWQKVYTSQMPYQAEIVKAVLSDRGFSPVLINKRDSAYGALAQGECEIYVQPENADQALEIIREEIKFD